MTENMINKKIGVGDIKLGALEKKYLAQVIDSSQLSYGVFSKKFEEEIAKEHESKFAVFSNSGTSALLVALLALKEKYKWSDGDEVIVPGLTFIATSNIVIQANMVPVFVDADEKTYNINPLLIEEKISAKTRCIIPVHMFGLPCEMDPILDIAKKHNLRIIEDSCETMFATYKGKKVGSFGDFGCFSTYVAHFLVTGVGGLTITNDPNLNDVVRSIINHGRDLNNKHKWFSFERMGYSFRCTELEAAIGLAQIEQKNEIIKKRSDNAHFYKDKLKSLEQFITVPFEPQDRTHSFMMFPIVVKDGRRNELADFLEKNNIETRDMPTVINQPYYKNIFPKLKIDDFPVTKKIMNSGFYIGTHQFITESDREYIINKFLEFYNKQTYIG
jgi:CDP-6-deoxy-D-xylo-4-hexulose-3-dehydrase